MPSSVLILFIPITSKTIFHLVSFSAYVTFVIVSLIFKQVVSQSHRFLDRGYKPRVNQQAVTEQSLWSDLPFFRKTLAAGQFSQSPLFFVTMYSTHAQQIKQVVRRNWTIIEGEVFAELPVVSFRCAPSLRDRLMHSHLPADEKVTKPAF